MKYIYFYKIHTRGAYRAVRVTLSSSPSLMLSPGYLASVLRLLHTRSNLHTTRGASADWTQLSHSLEYTTDQPIERRVVSYSD
jgi:hypothetical protein